MTDKKKNKQNTKSKAERSISLLCFLVSLSLFMAAMVCGTVSYLVLCASEHNNYLNQYEAATKQMKRFVQDILKKYHSAAISWLLPQTSSTQTSRRGPSWGSTTVICWIRASWT